MKHGGNDPDIKEKRKYPLKIKKKREKARMPNFNENLPPSKFSQALKHP